MDFEPVIGLEVHAELQTLSKMFCSCPVVDSTEAAPNSAVCPVCAGMPGVLPVINQRAVEYGLRVALALDCQVSLSSTFARKNYFYPDLPKGYQITQYEQPLARHGLLTVFTTQGERSVRIRRVHLEEDTGKLTHIAHDGVSYSLVDLNRAGIPLLEIVSEPDLHSAEEVRAYATSLRSILRYLEVNSGDMQKGVMRIEPNVSVRPVGSQSFGTRTEIKNLNSFRALERSVAYEIQRQSELLNRGEQVIQETLGWDDGRGMTFSQRVKESEDDYRYFPEPDLPPLELDPDWLEPLRRSLPEFPAVRLRRIQAQYGLNLYDSGLLTDDHQVADFFEQTAAAAPDASPKVIANWISGELFSLLNQAGMSFEAQQISPQALAKLIQMVVNGEINQNTAKNVLAEMFQTGKAPEALVAEQSLGQISDIDIVSNWVRRVLAENPEQLAAYLSGKESIARWLFGQVMRLAAGKANPQVVQRELDQQLANLIINHKS